MVKTVHSKVHISQCIFTLHFPTKLQTKRQIFYTVFLKSLMFFLSFLLTSSYFSFSFLTATMSWVSYQVQSAAGTGVGVIVISLRAAPDVATEQFLLSPDYAWNRCRYTQVLNLALTSLTFLSTFWVPSFLFWQIFTLFLTLKWSSWSHCIIKSENSLLFFQYYSLFLLSTEICTNLILPLVSDSDGSTHSGNTMRKESSCSMILRSCMSTERAFSRAEFMANFPLDVKLYKYKNQE